MKLSAVVFAIALGVFVLGCQDSNVTDPVASAPAVAKAQSGNTVELKGFVFMEGRDGAADYFDVSGQVHYTASPSANVKQSAVSLNLTVEAVLTPVYFGEMPAALTGGQSVDDVTTDGKTAIPIEKTYPVETQFGSYLLHINFLFDDSNLSVESMWLTASTSPVLFGTK